ncbi:phytanoyl-CoA dioxygenase family protein [Sphingomonas jaspsi]|uniref:phytanoyl-CoA dioxygenase family protein n=1 Tax=Sphingomonas jaspsi TaxID=392409 RepID=UPI0004B12D6C|nr:phytanoyl-CoA dioxygenase family protein [Sphingomonas jaspsi]
MMFDEKFRNDGLLVIDRIFDPEMIGRVRETVAGWTGPIDPARPPVHLRVDEGRLHMPIVMEGPLLDPALLTHPILDRILSSLLGADYVIDNLSLVTALAGAPQMHLHRDLPPLFPERHGHADLPPYAVTMVVPLVATDDETGTTAIAKGSAAASRVGDEEIDPPADWVEPHVPLGGCFLMDVRSFHRGLPNRSARDRPLLYAMFSRPWFTDSVNFDYHARMKIDRDTFAGLSPVQRYRLRRAAAPGLIDKCAAAMDIVAPGEADGRWSKR